MNFSKPNFKKISEALPRTVEDAMKGTSGIPGEFHVSALRERRLLTTLRIVAMCFIFSMITNVIMVLTLFSLLPLKEVRPFLVNIVDEGRVAASIKPLQDTFEAKDILTEKLVREYVVNRNEILRSDQVMRERWGDKGYLFMTTDSAEYRRFANQVAPQLEEIRRQDGQMRIDVLSVSKLQDGNIYVVDYRATSYDGNDVIIADKVYTATLTVEFRNITDMPYEQLLINPTGFTVINQSIAEKKQ